MLKFLITTPNSLIFKMTTGTCVSKANFYTHKVWRNLKDTFRDRLTRPSNPSHLSHQIRFPKLHHVRVFQKRTFKPKKSPTCCNVGIFDHDPQQFDFQNDTWYVCFKSELLDPQKEKSRTCCNFEIFDHDPQLDIKFETWHQILKPIRILVKTLIICIGTCIPYLCTVKV